MKKTMDWWKVEYHYY